MDARNIMVQWASAEIARLQADLATLHIGDTVRITGPMYTGQIGELRVIDEEDGNGLPYGVYLDSVEQVVAFGADELARVENIDMDDLPF